MNDPIADTHSNEDGEHPAAELNEREGASWPSEKGKISIVTVHRTLLNRTTTKQVSCVVTISVGKLSTIFKNNLREALEIKPK